MEILRQSAMSWWGPICIIACVALLTYALGAQVWKSLRGLVSLGLIAVGVAGTALVMLFGRSAPGVVIAWTFALLAIVSAVFYLRLRPQLAWPRVSLLLSLRVVALAALVLMFFEPGCRYVTRPAPDRPLLLVIDASGSMSFPDVQNGPTRVQSVWQALRPELRKINDNFVPAYWTFATDLQPLGRPEDLQKLSADGKGTDIPKALRRARFKTNHPESALILISDGIDNLSSDPVEAIRGLGWPINTVRVGSEQAEPATLANVAIENVEAPDDFLVGHASKVRITVKSSALNGRVVDVKLAGVDANGKPITEVKSAQRVLESSAEGQSVELPYTPRSIGVHRLAAWVDPIPGERSTVDNRQEFQGLAMDPRIKVLYIEGRLRPEYKPLRLALMRDPNVEAALILRTRATEFSAEGTVDGDPVRSIPTSLEQWKKLDVVILGDLDSSFLSPAQQQAIERFVHGGKGLVMLGGQNNFGPGGYKGTPIEAALPVFVGDTTSPQEKEQFVPRLTGEGAAHPMMEGLVEWFGVGDKPASKELPPLRGNVVVARAKSGARVIAVHPGRNGPDGNPQIILAAQQYGEGRSCAFTADTTNLWWLPLRGMGQDSPYNKFWGQMVRWLAGEDVRNRQRGAGIEGLLNKSVYQTGERVVVRAMVRDERGDATEYAVVNLALKKAGEKDRQVSLSAVEARRGLYEAELAAADLSKGDYAIELSAATKAGKLLGKQQLRFTVLPPADEMLKIAANPALLTKIAASTGGKAYELRELPALIDSLIRMDKRARDSEEVVVPLANTLGALMHAMGRRVDWNRTYRTYNLPMQAGLVVALLAAEWILRRRWQLP